MYNPIEKKRYNRLFGGILGGGLKNFGMGSRMGKHLKNDIIKTLVKLVFFNFDRRVFYG